MVEGGCNLSAELRLLHLNQAEHKASFLEKIRNPTCFSDQCCKSFLALIGAKHVKQRKKNEQMIRDWVNLEPVEKRKYFFLKKQRLIDLCVTELHGSKTSYSSRKVDDLIELLSQPRVALEVGNDTTPSREPTQTLTGLSDNLTKIMVEGALLKPLTGESRQATRIGLENEEPLLCRLLEDSRSKLVMFPFERNREASFRVTEIYRPGMVRKADQVYVKTSIDALGVLIEASDGREISHLIGIEVKTRTTDNTRMTEINMKMNQQRGKTFVKVPYLQ